MKMSGKAQRVHKAFCDLRRPFDPVKVYEALSKLVGLSEDVIERGIGKLYKDGQLKPPEERKRPKPSRRERNAGASGGDDFR